MFNNDSSSPTLTNVAFGGNWARVGGGMFNNDSSSPTLTNVTFSGNFVNFSGRSIYNEESSSPTLTNCILWGYPAAYWGEIDDNSGSTSIVSYSIVGGGWTGVGNLDTDPMFVRLPSAGADRTWGTADDDLGDLHLQAGSPAIDAGSNSGAPTFDLDGHDRPWDGDGDGSAVTDMGAYEYAVLYVDQDATGLNNGTSWTDAFADLQDALGAANTGDEIWVAEGTYTPADAGGDRALSFDLKTGVDLYGGFAGSETVRDARDWTSHVTVLSGDLNGDDGTGGDHSENSYHVVYASTVTDAIVDGFTITAGNADGPSRSPALNGGGMYNASGSPTLTNVIFSGNAASEDGGGMYNYHSSSPTLTNVTFSGNSADGRGGGMYNDFSAPTLVNVTFTGNSRDGMYNYDSSSPTLTNVTFTGNFGRGMYNYYLSSPTLTDVTFSDNSNGGMYNRSSSPTLTSVTFSGNSTTGSGGGMYNYDSSSPTLTNVTFTGNSADTSGGGMYNISSSPTLTNVTFSDNSAHVGGGMSNSGSSPTLTNVTFSSNSADSYGGGMSNFGSSSPTLTNVTFGSNSADGYGGGMFNDSSFPTLTNVTFRGNSAVIAGGGLFNYRSSSPTLTNVAFNGNSADYAGGMDNHNSSSPTLTNVTFSGNSAEYTGGGMYNYNSSSPTLTNVTFSGNSAGNGGGLYNYEFSSPTLTNCILWGNTAPDGPEILDAYSSASTVTYSIIKGGWTGAGNLDADPLFVRPPGAGADGMWGTADDNFGDLHLQAGSPAVDAGTNSGAPAFDLDGHDRPRDGDGDGSAVTDMGAYEYNVHYVDQDATGANDGTSWTDAFADLQDALAAANAGDEIWVAEGTYTPTGAGGDRGLSFNLKTGVDIYGGFVGSEAVREDRDWTSHVTVLSGDLNGDDATGGDNSENSYTVVYAFGVTDAVVDGFTITAGNADGSSHSPALNGGGMYNDSSSPTLTNVTFSANSGERGGGMYNWDSSSPTLTNVTFRGNSANDDGGGMYNDTFSSPTLANVSFSGNSANFSGGGMSNSVFSSPTLTNVTFSGNSANYNGGGMSNWKSSSPTLTSCILWGNTAPGEPEILDLIGSTSVVTYSIIGGGWTGAGNLDADPLFVRNPSDGGDGWVDDPATVGIDESANNDYGDLRLMPGSPAVDAGDPAFDPNDFTPPLVTDQRGAPRVADGNVDGSAIIDMGAFELINADLGDAPAPYPTLFADGGAYHMLTIGPRLGANRDWDPDGQPTADANGDDTSGTPDDEDGVTVPLVLGRGTLGATFTVEASGSSFLNAWIDFNRDGMWESNEQVAVDLPLVAGPNVVSLDVPESAVLGLTYARLRLTSYDTGGTLAPTGPANDGEVEDHACWLVQNTLDLDGTASSDVIRVWVGSPGGFYHQVEINGTVSHDDAAVYDGIRVDGLGGDDQITIYGTNQNETVTLQPGSVEVVGQTYVLVAGNVESITVDAGWGDDQVTMTGSGDSNRLYSYDGYANLIDSARSYSYQVEGFEEVTVGVPGGGRNYAFLYDSAGDDRLDADPDRVILTRHAETTAETETTASGFERVYAYATRGGDDAAVLAGTETTQDRFYSYQDYAILTESRRSFYFYVRGFDSVAAESLGSEPGYAYLYDSPGDDSFSATPTSAAIDRAASWSDASAAGFARVYTYSTRGGSDSAELTGNAAGGNQYRGYPAYSTLTDSVGSFYHDVRGFRSVTVIGSQTDTSSDRAYLYDSPGDDTLVGRGDSAVLRDSAAATYSIEALYFDLVYARSTDRDTNDTVDVDDSLAYDLIRSGTW